MKINMRCKLCPAWKSGHCVANNKETDENTHCIYGVYMRLVRAIRYRQDWNKRKAADKVIRQCLEDISEIAGIAEYIPIMTKELEFAGLEIIDPDKHPVLNSAHEIFGGQWQNTPMIKEDEK